MKRRIQILAMVSLAFLTGMIYMETTLKLQLDGNQQFQNVFASEIRTTPINIDGNSDLISFPGITGNGSSGNPYVIQNIIMTGISTSNLISISNTNEYLVLSNITYLAPIGFYYNPLYLRNVSNIVITNCNFTRTTTAAVYLTSNTNVSIFNSTFSNVTECVRASASTQIRIENNTAIQITYFCRPYAGVANLTLKYNTVTSARSVLEPTIIDQYLLGWNISSGNSLNGERLVAFINVVNQTFSGQACQVFVINATNVTINGPRFSASSTPAVVYKARGVTLVNMTFTNTSAMEPGRPAVVVEGSNSSVLVNSTLTRAANPISINFCKDILVRNVTINKTKETVTINGSEAVTFENCSFDGQEASRTAITATNVEHFTVRETIMRNVYAGIYVDKAYNTTLEENELSKVTSTGLNIRSSISITIKNMYANQSSNMFTFWNASKTTIENSTLAGSDAGISMTFCSECSIRNNTLLNISYQAINLAGVNDTIIDDCIFLNNMQFYSYGVSIYTYYYNSREIFTRNLTIRDSRFHNFYNGIYLSNVNACTVRGNDLKNITGWNGALYLHSVAKCNVSDNTFDSITNSQGAIGVYLTTESIIERNVITNATTGMTFYQSSRNTIQNNSIINVLDMGLILYDSNRNNITGNVISGSSKQETVAIAFWRSKYANVLWNSFTNVNMSIYLYDSDSNHVAWCNFTDVKHGIVLLQSKLNLVEHCTFDDIDVNGILFLSSKNNSIIGSQFTNVATCVFEDDASYDNFFENNLGCNYLGHGAPMPLEVIIGGWAGIGLLIGAPVLLFLWYHLARIKKLKILREFASGKENKSIILKLEQLTKDYPLGKDMVHALRGISLEIEKGEFVSLMGPSGSGKSTLLNIIATIDNPTSGNVILNGQPIHTSRDMSTGTSKSQRNKTTNKRSRSYALQKETALANIRRLQIGIIFQHYNLIPVLTALENVMLPMSILDIPESKKRSKALDLLSKVGLKEKSDRLPSQLSGGEQQRVSIARALANDPVIILADEPTGNLDQKTGRDIIKLFENLNTEHGQTFFIVTHDPAIASRTHRILKIRDGMLEPQA